MAKMTASDKKKLAKLKANLSELKNRYKNKTISKKEYDKKYKYIKAQIDKINKKYSKKKNVSFKDKAKNAKKKKTTKKTTYSGVYKDGEVLSTTYDVWISGKKLSLDKKECINSISIKETVDGSDLATIGITDPKFLFIDDNIFLEENKVKISLGWSNTTYRVEFNGYISAIDIEFTSSGVPQLTINCMDNTHRMNRKKKNRTFKKTTSANVVKKICKEYGYTCVIESGYKFSTQGTITQSDQTDIEFIQKLAGDETYPFTARLVGNKFYYVKKGKLGDSKITLNYMQYPYEVISFSPKLNKETQKSEISKSKVNNKNKSVDTTKGTNNGSEKSKSKSKSNKKTKTKNGVKYVYDPKTRKWKKA